MKPRHHTLIVTVISDVDKGQRQMQDRLLRWIEAFGHTSSSFGFKFDKVGVLTGKRIHQVGKLHDEP